MKGGAVPCVTRISSNSGGIASAEKVGPQETSDSMYVGALYEVRGLPPGEKKLDQIAIDVLDKSGSEKAGRVTICPIKAGGRHPDVRLAQHEESLDQQKKKVSTRGEGDLGLVGGGFSSEKILDH